MFRRIVGRGVVTYDRKGGGRIEERLSPDAVARAFKAVAKWIKMPEGDIEGESLAHGGSSQRQTREARRTLPQIPIYRRTAVV